MGHNLCFKASINAVVVWNCERRTDGKYQHEAPIIQNAFEDVQLPVKAAAVERVENLREDQCIKDKRSSRAECIALWHRATDILVPRDS